MPQKSTQLFYILVADSPIPLGRPLPLKRGIKAELVPLGEVLLKTDAANMAKEV